MKIFKFTILIIFLFCLSGCYDNIELNNLAIISGIGIDYQDNNYYLTYEILNDIKTEQNTTMKSYTISGKGKTLPEAFTDTNYKVGKKPYFAHLRIVLYSENIINNHLDKISDYLIRDTAIRDEFIPLAVKEVTPKEILEHNSDNIPVVSDFIMNLINNEKYNNNLAVIDTYQVFLTKLISNSSDAIISSLTINENDEITLSNFYTFNGYKKKSELSLMDSSLYNLLTQNTFSISFNKKYNGKNFDISITASDTNIEVLKDKININLNLKGRVMENNANLDLKDQQTYKMINEDFAKVIAEKVTNFIHILQEDESDVLGLQDIYYKKTRKENKGLWTKAEVNVNADLKVNTKGFIFEVKE